jgi:hypothetical protein
MDSLETGRGSLRIHEARFATNYYTHWDIRAHHTVGTFVQKPFKKIKSIKKEKEKFRETHQQLSYNVS